VQGVTQGLDQQGLPQPRDSLQKGVSPAEQAREDPSDQLPVAYDAFADLTLEGFQLITSETDLLFIDQGYLSSSVRASERDLDTRSTRAFLDKPNLSFLPLARTPADAECFEGALLDLAPRRGRVSRSMKAEIERVIVDPRDAQVDVIAIPLVEQVFRVSPQSVDLQHTDILVMGAMGGFAFPM
jgi:hypothetical protein